MLDFLVRIGNIFLSSMTVAIDFGLLYCIFVSKKITKHPGLTLFYFRFALDGIVKIGCIEKRSSFKNLCKLSAILCYFIIFIALFHPSSVTHSYQVTDFLVMWPVQNLVNARAFLALIIVFDRFFAVFLPIFHFQKRSTVSNVLLGTVVLCYPILDNFILWVLCQFELKFPSGCYSLGCLLNSCFLNYNTSHELVIHSITCSISLAIAIKLLLLANGKNKKKLKEMERANFLVLLDAATIFIFDIIPITAMFIFPKLVPNIGLIIPVSKSVGYALEDYLIYRTLKRKSASVIKIEDNSSKTLK